MKINQEYNLHKEASAKLLEEKNGRMSEIENQIIVLTDSLMEERKRNEIFKVIILNHKNEIMNNN